MSKHKSLIFHFGWWDRLKLGWAFVSGFCLGLIPVLPNRALTALMTSLGYAIWDGLTNPNCNFNSIVQAAFLGFISGYVASTMPVKLRLTSKEIKEFSRAIFGMIIGDVSSYA